ncbi:MAG TPA: hypothetical protein VJQ56_07805 [Blastocatellia bacterium]|nr:hypothetical protein [Blastocatellia bacterium]
MDSDGNKIDRALRAEADDLLWRRGLHALLEKYGRAHLTGSYALKLMTWRDLDTYLVGDEISVADFFNLGSEIAELLTPTKMHFRNEREAKSEGLPEGLYWGVYLGDEREGAWKIDIWAVNPGQFTVLDDYCNEIESKLTASTRSKILEIKSQCWMKPGYRRRYSSSDIYDAVLNEGVNNLAAFNEYLKRVRNCAIEDA